MKIAVGQTTRFVLLVRVLTGVGAGGCLGSGRWPCTPVISRFPPFCRVRSVPCHGWPVLVANPSPRAKRPMPAALQVLNRKYYSGSNHHLLIKL